MKRHITVIVTGIVIAAIFSVLASAASAQFTITIPKIPKIKKGQPQATPEQPSQPTTADDRSVTPQSDPQNDTPAAPQQKPCTADAVTRLFLEDIEKTRKQAEDYRPGLRDYYVEDFDDNENKYLKAALSPSRRQEWMGKWNQDMVRCITPALDALAAVARKTLPTYAPAGYTIHNIAEERLIRGEVNDLAEATVFKVGLESANWRIAKDGDNFPTSRYKYGMIWARYRNVDDGFCRIIYVNVVQDYAGGGTYAASRGNFIKTEFAGCPA